MIRRLGIAAVVLLASCATVEAPARQQVGPSSGQGLSPQEVSAGFAVAVVEGCAAAAEAGKTLAQLGSSKIVRETGPSMIPLKAGATGWAPIPGQGIVSIEEEADGKCNVSAYGPPVAATFDAVVSALRAKGYAPQPMPDGGPKFHQHSLALTADGRTVTVTLIGNDPGAAGMRSRFSIVSGFVTVKTP